MDKIEQPTDNSQQELDNIMENSIDIVGIKGTKHKYKIGWLKNKTIRKISKLMINSKDGEDDKLSSKIAACLVLNDIFLLKLFYWILWRWFYYIRQYSDEQLNPIIECGKKKVPQVQFYQNIISAIGMTDLMMTMTKKEVEQYRQERVGGQLTH